MFKRWFLLIFFVVQGFLQAVSAAASADNSSVDYWQKSGISFEKLKSDILVIEKQSGSLLKTKCFTDEKYMMACVQAINVMFERLPEPMIFIPPGFTFTELQQTQPAEDFSPFQLLPLSYSSPDYETSAKLRRKVLAAWKRYLAGSVFSSTGADIDRRVPPVNQLMDWLSRKIENSDQGVMSAIAGLTGFYQVYFNDHSRPQVLAELEEQLKKSEESYVGVGLRIGYEGRYPTVLSVVAGSPAANSGIEPGDQLLTISGEDTSFKKMSFVSDALKGANGNSVELVARRSGVTKPQIHRLALQKMELQNVEHRMLKGISKKIGYISLMTFFRKSACGDVERALVALSAEGAEGFILDLRGNGGGLLDQAVCVADLFLGREKLVTETKPILEFASPKKYYTERTAMTELPLVVLVDEGSASASEILAGALAVHERALLVGMRTFGKGTVQAGILSPFAETSKDLKALAGLPLVDFKGMVLFVTTSRFYLPSGESNQLVGISPQVEVFRRPGASSEGAVRREETDALNPVDADGEPHLVQPSLEVSSCLAGKATAKDYGRAGVDGSKDFQLLKARDTLLCQLSI